jgi:CBS domain-containing protein
MPVVSADGMIVGVITEADIIRALNQDKRLDGLTAGSLMTAPPVTVDAEAPIDSVMKTGSFRK